MPDLVDASSDADILVFVIPHQFIGKVCDTMKGKIKSDAVGISLIKVKSLVLVLSFVCLIFISSSFQSGPETGREDICNTLFVCV